LPLFLNARLRTGVETGSKPILNKTIGVSFSLYLDLTLTSRLEQGQLLTLNNAFCRFENEGRRGRPRKDI